MDNVDNDILVEQDSPEDHFYSTSKFHGKKVKKFILFYDGEYFVIEFEDGTFLTVFINSEKKLDFSPNCYIEDGELCEDIQGDAENEYNCDIAFKYLKNKYGDKQDYNAECIKALINYYEMDKK